MTTPNRVARPTVPTPSRESKTRTITANSAKNSEDQEFICHHLDLCYAILTAVFGSHPLLRHPVFLTGPLQYSGRPVPDLSSSDFKKLLAALHVDVKREESQTVYSRFEGHNLF